MVEGFWARALNLGRGPATPLEADLRRITEADSIDVPPKEALLTVTQSSYNADDRREILRHLQECLGESSGYRWRRVHGGLILLTELLKNGAPSVVTEIAEGMHFDPIQRLSFLERFEYKDDRRVQNMVRQKATALRAELLDRLHGDLAAPSGTSAGSTAQAAKGGTSPMAAGSASGRAARSSDKGGSPGSNRYTGFGSDSAQGQANGSNSSYVGFGSDDVGQHLSQQGESSGRKKVNGLVAVGHRDDTDSDSSGDGGRRRGQRKQAQTRGSGAVVHARGGRNALEDSTDSESDGDRRRSHKKKDASKQPPPPPPPRPPPAVEVDLLGGFDESPKSKTPAASGAAAPSNLLDF